MSNKIVCLVGKSGSGKTKIEDELANKGYNVLKSYTTRGRRFDGENSRTFVTKEQFDEIRNDLVAYTVFDEHEYGATRQQVEGNDLYVIDPDGVEVLARKIGRKNMLVVYLKVNAMTCFDRMVQDHTRNMKSSEQRSIHDNRKFAGFENYDVLLRNEDMNDFAMNVEILQTVISHWCKK